MAGDLSWCFMCGSENPDGMHLKKEVIDGKPTMIMPVEKRLSGFSGIMHGGFTAGLADEVMCWAAESSGKVPGGMVTISLDVKYLSPAIIGHTLVAVGRIDAIGERNVYASATLTDQETEKVVSKATGVYRIYNFDK